MALLNREKCRALCRFLRVQHTDKRRRERKYEHESYRQFSMVIISVEAAAQMNATDNSPK